MNLKIDNEIRESIAFVLAKGVRISQGIWFEFSDGWNIEACDPLGAVLYKNNLIDRSILTTEGLVRPGFIKLVCTHLDIDVMWLRRFWLGFDRGYQVMIVNDKDESETKDEVAAYGIQLYREFVKR